MKKNTKVEEVSKVAEVKSYDEKVSDYEKHFDDIGMHDPSTEAAIAQMKTATPRSEASDSERAPDLVARDEVRLAKQKELRNPANPGDVIIGSEGKTRKEVNEEQSEVTNDRQEHDIKVQKGKEAKFVNGTNRDQKKTSR